MSILKLLDKKWAKNFFRNRLFNYLPEAKELIDLKIEILKVFLNYQRLTVKYDLLLTGKNKDFKKSIIAKAEKKDSGNKRDYLTNIFLRAQGLNNLVSRPLEYYEPLRAFFYEMIEGLCLKQLSIEKKANEFFSFIPRTAKAIKKIHKIKRVSKILKEKGLEEKKYRHYLFLVKKYYPFGCQRFEKIIRGCQNLKSTYRKILSPENNCLTHGDLHSGNIFIARRQIKFLDFSDSCFNDPLNDLGCFFINTELMFEYDFHQNYQKMVKEVVNLFCKNYFQRPVTETEKQRIHYYLLNNLTRIISYVALSESQYKKSADSNDLLEKLIKIGEEKLKNI